MLFLKSRRFAIQSYHFGEGHENCRHFFRCAVFLKLYSKQTWVELILIRLGHAWAIVSKVVFPYSRETLCSSTTGGGIGGVCQCNCGNPPEASFCRSPIDRNLRVPLPRPPRNKALLKEFLKDHGPKAFLRFPWLMWNLECGTGDEFCCRFGRVKS